MTVPIGWPVSLAAGPVALRPPQRRDAAEWSEVRLRNQAWLTPWEPTVAGSWEHRHSPAAWRTMRRSLMRSARVGASLPFIVTFDNRLVGQLTVSNILYGAQRAATIGYWVDGAVAGRGITPTAVALACDHCFGALRLHRIELDIRPENAASVRVAEKLGFRREGYLERFLDIDGGWRDHLLFALTVEELQGTSLVSRLSGVRPNS